MRIKKLSTIVANQIAAGEVVERPASVVKELLENSLDAGSRQIHVDIVGGGRRLIRVRDDGVGVHPEDLSLAVASHATSKIAALQDLSAIASFGFRGEALASISAVSTFSLVSRAADQPEAWQLRLAGKADAPTITAAAHPFGTTVTVAELFFNVPVRAKFLRSDKTEADQVAMVVKRLALSQMACAMTFQQEDKRILQLPSAQDQASQTRRVQKIFGQAFLQQSVLIDSAQGGMHLTGWLGLPDFLRSQADLQYCYINHRMVRDKLLNHAIRQAYGDTLYPGKHPAYLLYLSIDPAQVDVNVHPTKHEVRFHEPRMVHDFVVSVLSKALKTVTKQVDLDAELTLPMSTMMTGEASRVGTRQVAQPPAQYGYTNPSQPSRLTCSLGEALGQIGQHLIVARKAQSLLVFDVGLAQAVLTYHQLCRSFADDALKVRPLLVPLKVPLDSTAMQRFESQAAMFAEAGWHLECLDENTLVLRSMPTVLVYADLLALIQAALLSKKAIQSVNGLFELMADHNGRPRLLSLTEMDKLLRDLEASGVANHQEFAGKIWYRELTAEQLLNKDGRFLR